MAYCVHCGVKLHEGERRCPLCGTVSIDPNEQAASDAQRTYPVRTPEQELRRGRRFFLMLETMLLLVPAGLCCLIDLLTGGGIYWSVYTLATLVSLFLVSAVPVLLHQYRTYSTIWAGLAVQRHQRMVSAGGDSLPGAGRSDADGDSGAAAGGTAEQADAAGGRVCRSGGGMSGH